MIAVATLIRTKRLLRQVGGCHEGETAEAAPYLPPCGPMCHAGDAAMPRVIPAPCSAATGQAFGAQASPPGKFRFPAFQISSFSGFPDFPDFRSAGLQGVCRWELLRDVLRGYCGDVLRGYCGDYFSAAYLIHRDGEPFFHQLGFVSLFNLLPISMEEIHVARALHQ